MSFEDNIKQNINYFFKNIDSQKNNMFVNTLVKYFNNNIYIIGIGKSFNISNHFSDLLKCINFHSFSLNSASILHGDIGCINKNDLIIIISNSGNTKELIDIIPIIQIKKNPHFILLTSNESGKINNIVNDTYYIPVKNEDKSCFSLIPTNSVINYILYINNIIGSLIERTNLDNNTFINNHFSGNIGNIYKKVSDIIIKPENCSIIDINNNIKKAIISMNVKKMGICIIIENEKPKGIITNRDICVFLENNGNINENINSIIKESFYFIDNDDVFIKNITENYSYIPIIKNDIFLGIIQKIH